MTLRILEERSDLYIIQDERGISTVPRTKYFELKYKDFASERIKHVFDQECRIEETYNDGIFNAYRGNRTIQISDAENIAETIMNNDAKRFREIFTEWYSIQIQDDVLRALFVKYPHRIDMKKMRGKYIIDGVFMVDNKGSAHKLVNNKWKFLCIVASGSENGQKINLPTHGEVELSSLTIVILSKVMFLLHPNPADSVFMNQLDKELKSHVLNIESRYSVPQ